jgi:hypothetical protein
MLLCVILAKWAALPKELTSYPVGNDVRKAAFDGFPSKQIIASDIQPGEWLFLKNTSLFG